MKRPRRHLVFRALLGAVLTAGAAQGAELREQWRLNGRIGVEGRGFARDPAYPDQGDGGEASLVLNPELDWHSKSDRYQAGFEPFLRLDGQDKERTHYDVREAYWRARWRRWELTAGVNRVFWGVTESRHLVDVINQTDLVEDIDGEDKLGQPMIEIATDGRWGRLEGFALLGFRDRTFPGAGGRLRSPLPVDTDAAEFESGAGRGRIDGALRWSHYFGDWDVGVHLFRGTDREPVLVPDFAGQRFVPYYSLIDQAGIDLQYTHDAWLFKLEALSRAGEGDRFGASVGGFEYTFYQVGDSAADVGLLVEYLYDGRDATAPPTIYDDDVFVGSRLAWNDAFDTQLLAGVIVDRNDGSVAAFLEAERRVGNRIKLELELRWFANVAATNTLWPLESDSHLTVRLSRYF